MGEDWAHTSTTVRGLADRIGPGMFCKEEVLGEGVQFNSLEGSSSGESEIGEMQWSPQKDVHCAKAVCVTVKGSRGGGVCVEKGETKPRRERGQEIQEEGD